MTVIHRGDGSDSCEATKRQHLLNDQIRRTLVFLANSSTVVMLLFTGVSCDSAPQSTASGNSGARTGGAAAEGSEEVKQVPVAETEEEQQKILKRFIDELIAVEPGTAGFPAEFTFGSNADPPNGVRNSLPEKVVMMSDSFRISSCEVTQELYQLVMGENPSRWVGARNSVESMKFASAVEFCEQLTSRLADAQMIGSDECVRLPTEQEWEYCCRAGSATLYCFGDQPTQDGDVYPEASRLGEYAWHTGNAAGNDPEVAVLKPNDWGLYDVHGYLWEYVVPQAPAGDPAGIFHKETMAGSGAVIIRGGSWKDAAALHTSASRMRIAAETMSDAIGFRCVIAKKPGNDR